MKCRLSVFLLLAGLCSLTQSAPLQYYFITTALPWLKAQMYCREHHVDLATVSNTEDMNQLVNTVQESSGGFTGKAWIGLHDNLTSWRWSLSDSSYYGDQEADYRNWGFGQPDNFFGGQMCVKMLSEGVWDDSRCSPRNPFICYDGKADDNQKFVFVEKELSWPDAQLYCRKFHTDLASVRNKEENQEMQLLAQNRTTWIGLYRMQEWSDQSGSTYRNWRLGQPDNFGGRQNCTATHLGNAGLWSDEECSTALAFVCYRVDVSDKPVLSTASTVTPKITTSVGDETTVPVSVEMTSSEKLLTPPADQTTHTTGETSNHPSPSTTGMTTAMGSLTSGPVSSDKTSSEEEPSAITESVINLRVKFTSKRPLSEDDIQELVLVQFYNLLMEMGLPASIKVGLKRPLT